MNKTKIQNLKDLEFYAHIDSAINLIKKWRQQSPDNKELKLLEDSFVGICFWCNTMEQEARLYKTSLSDYRLEKNIALDKYNELKKKYDKMKELEL